MYIKSKKHGENIILSLGTVEPLAKSSGLPLGAAVRSWPQRLGCGG
jgi:hypothetical protein